LLDLPSVARRLGVNERRIPFLKWGRLLRFDPVEIEAWLDEARRGRRSA
jgi:hypothetical protein